MLQPDKKKQLDSNIRKMLENGATQEDVIAYSQEFKEKFSEKKKEDSDSTSTDQKLDSEAKEESGSLDTPETEVVKSDPEETNKTQEPKGQLVKDLDAGKYDARINELADENERFEAAKQQRISTVKQGVAENSQLSEEEVKEIADKEQEEANDDFGFMDKMKRHLSVMTMLNPVIPTYKYKNPRKEREEKVRAEIAKEQKVQPDEVDPEVVTAEAKKQRIAELTNEKKEAKIVEYIEDLPEGQQKEYFDHLGVEKGKLQTSNLAKLAEAENLIEEINAIDDELNNVAKNHNPEQEYNEEYYQQNNAQVQKLNQLKIQYNNLLDGFNDNLTDLQDVETELDIFKRNYGKWHNFVQKTKLAALDIGANLAYLQGEVLGNIPMIEGQGNFRQSISMLGKAQIEKERELLRKSKSVSDIKSWEDGAEWALDLIAEQAPNTALMAASGGASLGVMGFTSAGGKLYDIEAEERQTGKEYSLLEKYGTSVLFGVAEAASEKISLGQIGKAKRVFSAVGKNELKQSVFKSLKTKLPEYFSDVAQEGLSEGVAQFSQNLTDKYLLGKDIDVLEGVGDAMISGAFMSGMVYKMPGIATGLVKTVMPADVNQQIGENFEGVLQINEQLKQDLRPSVAEALKQKRDQLLEKNKVLVDKTIENVDNLSKKDKGDLLSIENEKFKIRKQVEDIQNESLLDEDTKKGLLDELGENVQRLEAKKSDILSGNTESARLEQKKSELDQQNRTKNQEEFEQTKRQQAFDNQESQALSEREQLRQKRDGRNSQVEQIEEANKQKAINDEQRAQQERARQEDEQRYNAEKQAQEEARIDDLGGNNTVGESIDEDTIYTKDGKTGRLRTKGDIVVFETENEIVDLGNVNEIGDSKLRDHGVLQEQAVEVSIDDNNGITIQGETYQNTNSNPLNAVSQDKNGNYSVTLENSKGEKRTFRGRNADNIVYQLTLKDHYDNATEQQRQAAEQLADEELARSEAEQTSNEEANRNTAEGQDAEYLEYEKKQRANSLANAEAKKGLNQREEATEGPKETDKGPEDSVKKNVYNLAVGKEGYAGFAKTWWNNSIYNTQLGYMEDPDASRISYIELSIENDPEGIHDKKNSFFKAEADRLGIKYEATQKQDTPSNGDTKSGTRDSKQQTKNTDVQSSSKSKDGKGETKVNKKDGRKTKSNNRTKAKGVSQDNGLERGGKKKTPKRKPKSKSKRKAVTKKIDGRGKTPLDERKISKERLKALKIEVADAEGIVKQFFIAGGTMLSKGLTEVFSKRKNNDEDTDADADKKVSNKEVSSRSQYLRKPEKGGISFYDIIDKLYSDVGKKLGVTEDQLRTALGDVVRMFHNPQQMALSLLETYGESLDEKTNESGEELFDTPNGKMTKAEIDAFVAAEARLAGRHISENDLHDGLALLESLTEEELIRLAEEQDLSFKDLMDSYEQPSQEEFEQMDKDATEAQESFLKELGVAKNEFDLARLLGLDTMEGVLNKLQQQLKDGTKGTLGIHIPAATAQIAITAMKAAVKTAKTTADVISAGVNAIKASDWYKKQSDKRKAEITPQNLQSVLKLTVKDLMETEGKLALIKDRLKNKTINQKQAYAEIKDFLKNHKIKGLLTPTETNRLIERASRLLIVKDLDKAMDRFIDNYHKTEVKARRRAMTKRDHNKDPDSKNVADQAEVLVRGGATLDEVKDFFDSEREKKIAETVFHAIKNEDITPEQALKRMKESHQKAEDLMNVKKSRAERFEKFRREVIKSFTDRQYLPKKLVHATGMQSVYNLFINSKGASGKANRIFEKAYNDIYKNLSKADRKTLDMIIQAKRFIAIDKNRTDRGKGPVAHPDFRSGAETQKALNELKEEIGTKKFKDFERRATAYFDVFKQILADAEQSGLVSTEVKEMFENVDYQPRVFIKHLVNFDEEVSDKVDAFNTQSNGGLSKDQVKEMTEGSASALMTDSAKLLTLALSTRYKSIAMNNVNRRFMGTNGEFHKAMNKYENLKDKEKNGEKLTSEEKRFMKYFQELKSKIKDNPVIKMSKNGNPVYKYPSAPPNFSKAYYYENGVQHQFLIENELHDAWFDNLSGFLNSNAKEFISYASGAALVKGIATGNNPAFVIVNSPRDFMFTLIFSKEYSTFVPAALVQLGTDVFKAIKDIKNSKKGADDNALNLYIKYGGDMSFLSTQGRLDKKSVVGRAMEVIVKPRTKDKGKAFLDAITLKKLSNYSEIVFRMSLFQRSVNSQLKAMGVKSMNEITDQQTKDDIYNEAVASARSLLDFSQGGTLTKDAESFIPYINTGVQGGRVAYDAFRKNPAKVGAKMAQSAAIGASLPVGISLALISMLKGDDEEEERSTMEIYLDAIAGVSMYQRVQYFNIITGRKTESGDYEVIKIAKNQQMSPLLNLGDNILHKQLSQMTGTKEKSREEIFGELAFSINTNIIPIDVTSVAGAASRTPILKAGFTYTSGHDFFRDQPLSSDINDVPEEVEGLRSNSIEQFYKEWGAYTGFSPARTKGAIEAMITSPSTNPFIGLMYGGAEASVSDGDFKQKAEVLRDGVMKSLSGRMVGKTSEFNKSVTANRLIQKEVDKILAEEYRHNYLVDKLAKDYVNNEISEKDATDKLVNEFPEDGKRLGRKIKDLVKLQDIPRAIIDIKYQKSAKAKAYLILRFYGDIMNEDNREENMEIIKQMKRAGGVLTKDTIEEYIKLIEEVKPQE